MSRWFRLYDEMLDDPKVQRLPPPLFKAWVNLLCLASRNGGALPPIEDIAFALRVDEERLGEWMDTLAQAGLIDEFEGTAKPHNWDSRQFNSDSSTARVRAYREKKAQQDQNVAPPKTRNVTETADVTPPDTEADTEQKLSLRSSSARAAKPGPSFEAFWEAYPQKIGKTAAKAAFDKAVKREPSLTIESLLQAIDAYRRGKPPDREWCHPTTWLNQGRWADDWTKEQQNAGQHHHSQGQPASRPRSGADTFLAAVRAEAEQLDDRGFPDRRDTGADFGDGRTLDLRANEAA